MSLTQPCPTLSPDYLLDAPLGDLLTETGVEVIDSSIDDRGFYGAVVQRKDGQMLLAMPSGRSEFEHDTVARYLIAQAFGVELAEMPPPFITTAV